MRTPSHTGAPVPALQGSRGVIEQFRTELEARRNLFYEGVRTAAAGVLSGDPPLGAFYAFLKIEAGWDPESGRREAATGSAESSGAGPEAHQVTSRSWALTERLITEGRVGCIPGVDFGQCGEGHVRFCFARERAELEGALASMRTVLAGT